MPIYGVTMDQVLQSILNGDYTKTISINVAELIRGEYNIVFVHEKLNNSIKGYCRAHTHIHVEGITLAFTKRCLVTYNPLMAKSNRIFIDYNIDSFSSWVLEKKHCSNELLLEREDVKQAIDFLTQSHQLEYTSEHEDAVELQIKQFQDEQIVNQNNESQAVNTSFLDKFADTPLMRSMDRFFI